jgi:deoxyribonuclease-4
MQIFTHNPRSWATRPIGKQKRDAFKELRKKFDINPVYSHASYLINIASPDKALRDMSVRLLREGIERASYLGVDYVVLHTGVAYDPKGRHRAASSIRKTLGSRKSGAGLLLENTAGKRGDIGSSIEDMAWLIEHLGGSVAGICMDSCHAFAAGYNIRDAVGIKKLSGEIGKYIGFEAVKLIHLNDSKGEAGSRIDRHEHIGRGKIGRVALKRLITHRPFLDIPVVLETPKKSNDDDIENLSIVRAMLAG